MTTVGQLEATTAAPPAGSVAVVLDGYAVAQPWSPAASSPPGFAVAATTLAFLRGVFRVLGTPATAVDCASLRHFSPALRTLGATPADAVALRRELLRDRARLTTRLSLTRRCPYR